MNELAGFLAEAIYNPSFNVYLVWLAGTLSIVYYGHYFLTTKYEDIIQNNDGWAPIYFWNGKFNFGLWLAIYPAFIYLLFGLLNDVIVIFIIGGTYKDIYNMMWFSQFIDASTIFDMLDSISES